MKTAVLRTLLLGVIVGLGALFFRPQPDREGETQPKQPQLAPAALPQIRQTKVETASVLPAQRADGQPVRAPEGLSLEEILGVKGTFTFKEKLAAVHALPRVLSPEQSRALLSWVREHAADAAGQPQESSHMALVNDILNVLQRQDSFRAELVILLETLAADSARPPVLRDYALQHLASLALAPDSASQQDSPWESQWKIARGNDPMLASGAMLRLLAASRRGLLAPERVHELEAAALRLAESPETPSPVRVSALQVCAQLGCSKIRETALKLAQSDSEPFPLRIAAIAALGKLSDQAEVRNLLTRLTDGPNIRLRGPARSAVNIMRSRTALKPEMKEEAKVHRTHESKEKILK